MASDNSRNEATALSHGRTYRRGADVSQTSSIAVFVLIGLAVGVLAFGLMSFCLPDPLAKVAVRDAQHGAQLFPPPPPVLKPVDVAPPVADMVSATSPTSSAQVTVTTVTPAPKQARVVHRAPAKKAANGRSMRLPSNPYANGN